MKNKDLAQAAATLGSFAGTSLSDTLSGIEFAVKGIDATKCNSLLAKHGASHEVLAAAGLIKQLAGQINVAVHALGVLLCLPHILKAGEVVQYVSLGAGNTGREFDLETNQRVAEFKFIHWQGGAEVIRQNALFKDFYNLAESDSKKTKYVYVLGVDFPLKFLNGNRSMSSVLSRHVRLSNAFKAKYPKCEVVRDYFALRNSEVKIEDVSSYLPGLIQEQLADSEDSSV